LDARSRLAIEQRFGLLDGVNRSYREVSDKLGGITPEGTRRLIKRTLEAISRCAELEDYQ